MVVPWSWEALVGVAGAEEAGPGDWDWAAITDRRPPGRPGRPRNWLSRLVELGCCCCDIEDMKLAKGLVVTASASLCSLSGSLTTEGLGLATIRSLATSLGSSLTGSRMDISAVL